MNFIINYTFSFVFKDVKSRFIVPLGFIVKTLRENLE